ncbi:MAG TPA: tRNA (adenosine(37)-N6)-dimethylallyltransferase MiaA [Terriglobia bacterium]|nr:tRNA (adenosine(37)-N6)-dimethylallyltransferase MiaA [Terriglobia bacterium]
MERLDPNAPDYPLIVVVGPTASGKSALAVRLALAFGGEVINFDSVQVYRGFDIGSGKLGLEERRGVPHHLLDVAEPGARYTAGEYRRQALKVLEDLRSRRKLPVMTGGTGLYLRALLLGLFEGPARSDELRRRLSGFAERRGREFLHRMLARKDRETAARIHPRDAQKVIRALEVCLVERRRFSDLLREGREGVQGFRALKIGLSPPRAELARRINVRTERMFAGGIMEEVREALGCAGAASIPLEALGYRQARACVEGTMTHEEAIRDTQAQTRQYAKRQMTWFRREAEVQWFGGFGDDPVIEQQVFRWLASAVAGPSYEVRGPVFSSL